MKYCIFSVLIICLACKDNGTEINQAPEVIDTEDTRSIDPYSTALQNSDLTANPWAVEMVLDNGRIEDKSPWKGSVIVFKADGKYSWEGEQVNDQGQFTLDPQKNILLLDSEDPSINSEWSVKYRRSTMVWLGTPKFGQHSLQMKLIKN
ncbi:hypothetical protein [Portibacter marinus]|uniref:hypothetical protein n=1 Tax=Portibacter marinus TaxID=2898660 RepID=UPI001F1EDBD6|nr:hypothetical protein [Portibacter marinus]